MPTTGAKGRQIETSRVSRASRADVSRRMSRMPGVRGRASSQLASPASWAWLTGEPFPEALPATELGAMGLPPFGRGVALLANAIAGTHWRAMRWDPELGVSVVIPDQPAVLQDPDPLTTPWHYRWAATEDLILYGNHFALFGDIDFRTLRPGWLIPLPADDIWLIIDPETYRYQFTVAGEMLDADQLFHVSAGNRSGEILGRGCLRQYAEWLGGAIAAEDHAARYFAGGTLPPAVLQSPTVLTQEQADELKAKWRALTATREPVILPTGYVLTPIVSNAENAQLVQSRQWNASEVAMLLGIPPYKLGLPGATMTYQNIETADIEFVRDSVDRYAGPLIESFTKWLLPRGTSANWDYAGRMRADQTTTANVLTQLTGAGLLTQNEARAMLNRPPLPDEPPEPEPDPEPEPENAPAMLTPETVD